MTGDFHQDWIACGKKLMFLQPEKEARQQEAQAEGTRRLVYNHIGQNWITQLLDWHPELAAWYAWLIDRQRVHANNPITIKDHLETRSPDSQPQYQAKCDFECRWERSSSWSGYKGKGGRPTRKEESTQCGFVLLASILNTPPAAAWCCTMVWKIGRKCV